MSLNTENKQCTFCSLPEIQARTVFENELVWAFLTNIPITEGHTLVCPKRCVASLQDLSNEEKMAMFEAAEQIMEALKNVYGAEGFNCAWNQEKLAGQSVPHFHLHIVPRKEGDKGLLGFDPRNFLYRTGDREPSVETELLAVSQKIKEFFT